MNMNIRDAQDTRKGRLSIRRERKTKKAKPLKIVNFKSL